jgi:septum formation protein
MLILASASPRRADLLRAARIPFEAYAPDVDETPRPDEPPDVYVQRLALAKANAVHAVQPDRTILAADTIVVCNGRMLGKPRNADDARSMLVALSGVRHTVLTGVALIARGETRVAIDATDLWFARLSDAEIDAYVASGEPMDKAGAYAVQGQASRFVERIDGAYANVVGLPIARVYRLLVEAGVWDASRGETR